MLLLFQLFSLLATPFLPLLILLPRLRVGFSERLGLAKIGVEPGAIWIHAASLGEGRLAANLISGLQERLDLPILRTCSSATARNVDVGADQTLLLPFDNPLLLGRMLDRVRPRILILVEAELWPCLIAAAARRKIPVVVVGARVGAGLRRLAQLPGLWSALQKKLLWMPVDAEAAAFGGGEPTGDLKATAQSPTAPLRWKGDAVIGACTYVEEEGALLEAVRKLNPRPLLVLAPRESDRFGTVAAWLQQQGENFVRRSSLTDGRVPAGVQVLLLDSFGELGSLYVSAKAAFIGGTFVARVGGHSPMEAAAVGCPVVHGPHTRTNAAAFDALDSFLCLDPEDLGDSLTEAMAAPRSNTAAIQGQDRVDRVVDQLVPLLRPSAAHERWLRPLLWPLSLLWSLAAALRPRPLTRARIPVISVGSLLAGGAGKTPVAAWLAERLTGQPVVVSRGYGRRRGSDVRTNGEAKDLGDELCMLARRGLRVASAPDRRLAVERAASEGATIAILDDGLQVGALARDLEVVVVDARWPGGGGPIPVGERRLPWSWLGKADVLWVNHGPIPEELRSYLKKDVVIVEARYRAAAWLRRGQKLPLDSLPKRPAVAMAGIARPEGFFRQLRRLGIRPVRSWAYPDHHNFTWMDLQSIEAWLDDHLVLLTEKDAARLPRDLGTHALVVEPELVSGEEELLRLLQSRGWRS